MKLLRTWMIITCAAGLLTFAPGASAKPGYAVVPGYNSMALSLKGSHGYRIYVERRGRQVFLLAGGTRSTVAYVPHSRAQKSNEIEARFPGVGRISVWFRPQGPSRSSQPPSFPGCKSGEIVKQRGYFVGTIRFRGERGYTTAYAKRARGAIETVGKEVCKRSAFDDSDSEPESDRTEFSAYSKSGGRTVAFSASSVSVSDQTLLTAFSGFIGERRRGMKIFRSTFVSGERAGIVPGDTRPFPLSATITPPAPFQGSAEFQRTPEGDSTWTGSLTVPLPGLGRVSLAGPDFTARLCQRSGCTGNTIDGHSLPWIARNPR
jgi:hypothetical protein